MNLFIVIILVIGLVFLLKCFGCNMSSGGGVVDRPARIISISGKWIPSSMTNFKLYPLPERVVLEYPNIRPIIITPNNMSKTYGGAFGIVSEYQGDNGKVYMVKSQKESDWNKELRLWRRLSPRLKGLFTETYFGSPNNWMVSLPEREDTIDNISIYSPPPPGSFMTPPQSVTTGNMTPPPFIQTPPPAPREEPVIMIPIDDYGIVVMEKYDGSLRNLVGRLDIGSIKSVMRQLLSSLDLLKDSGFLYTDLKLDNIVYKRYGNSIVIKLIDIGSLCDIHTCQIANYNPTMEKHGTFPRNCPFTIMLNNDYGIKDCLNYTITICNLILFQLSSNTQKDINLFANQAEVDSYLRFGLLPLGNIISTKYSSFKQFKEALS